MTSPSLRSVLDAGQVVVLDGGLATQLESQGHDLSSARWSARLVVDDPDAVVAAHRAYFEAGAQVAITASYQAAGMPEALRTSVRLAERARSSVDGGLPLWVAASVGPYGALLADGSEYRGDYGLSVAELRVRHRPTIQTLLEAEPDLLALETIPCLVEVEALLAEVEGTGVDCWLSLTCADGRTRAGEPVAEAYAMARDVAEVVAVGVNCTRPAEVGGLVRRAAQVSGLPVVVYPNAGEEWDAAGRTWVGAGTFSAADVQDWISAGAQLVGGCCRVGPDQIRALADVVHTTTDV
ncbi:MAG TPA: homocysteine S-methyltransferase [Propionibacteriaceae bacterium]